MMTFPWDLNITGQSVGSLEHTWNNNVMTDALSAYVRSFMFIVEDTSSPITSVTWYQA